MKRYSGQFYNCLHPIYQPPLAHEYQGYHMDLEYHLTPVSCLLCNVVHEGRQADATAMEKSSNESHHICQYSWRTFKTKLRDLSFKQFPSPCKPKEFLDPGTHGDMEEGILEIQPHSHSALLKPLPDSFNFFHAEIYVTNIFIELFQIED